MKRTKKSERFRKDELVIGRRPVLEALRCGNLERIYLAAGQKGEIIDQIIRGAGQLAVPLQIVERRDLSRMAGSGKHQGAVALAAPFRYLGLGELMERAKAERGPRPLAWQYCAVAAAHSRCSGHAGVDCS